jgi:hypothetical protein
MVRMRLTVRGAVKRPGELQLQRLDPRMILKTGKQFFGLVSSTPVISVVYADAEMPEMAVLARIDP